MHVLSDAEIIKYAKYISLMAKESISPQMASKVSKNYWNTLAQTDWNTSLEFFESYYAKITEIMKPIKNETILDAGCGGGELTYLFHKDGFNVKGFDSSQYLVTKARKRFGNDLFYVDDLVNMKKRRERFKRVFLNGVFVCIHPTYYKTVLKNLFNITEDDGKVYLLNDPDYSKRNRFYNQFRARARVLNIFTFFPCL